MRVYSILKFPFSMFIKPLPSNRQPPLPFPHLGPEARVRGRKRSWMSLPNLLSRWIRPQNRGLRYKLNMWRVVWKGSCPQAFASSTLKDRPDWIDFQYKRQQTDFGGHKLRGCEWGGWVLIVLRHPETQSQWRLAGGWTNITRFIQNQMQEFDSGEFTAKANLIYY